MKRFALTLIFSLFTTLAHAQCNGVFPNNTVCGNVTGSSNLPRATNPSAFLGAAGGLNGQIQYNNAGALGGFTMAGDCTASIPNITCTKTNGVNFGSFATGTDAANLTGTVSVNRFNSGTSASGATYLSGDGTWRTQDAVYATAVAAIAATIPTTVTTLRTNGYNTEGDGGGATYICSGSPPTHLAYFTSANTRYCAIDELEPNILQLGGTRFGTTGNVNAYNAGISYCLATFRCNFYIPYGTYNFDSRPDTFVPPVDGSGTMGNILGWQVRGAGAGITQVNRTYNEDDNHGVFTAIGNPNAGYFAVNDMTIVSQSSLAGGAAIMAWSGRQTAIILGGTITAGNTISISISGVGTTTNHTVVGGDTFRVIANSLATKLNTLSPNYIGFVANNVLYVLGPDSATPTITTNLSGGATLTTVVGASQNLNQGFVRVRGLNITSANTWSFLIRINGTLRTVNPCCVRGFSLNDSELFGAEIASVALQGVVAPTISNTNIFGAGGTSNVSLNLDGGAATTYTQYCNINIGYSAGINMGHTRYCGIKVGALTGNVNNSANTANVSVHYSGTDGAAPTLQTNWVGSAYITP